jgi:hypothetical protein
LTFAGSIALSVELAVEPLLERDCRVIR